MNTRRSTRRSTTETEAWQAVLVTLIRSMRERPLAWLLAIWLIGWGLVAWHAINPPSWDAVWAALNNVLSPSQFRHPGEGPVVGTWLHEIARWGQVALYASTAILALYVSYALWVWHKYKHTLMPEVREERLQRGRVLEVLVPRGSKSDARASADMFGQLWNLLSDMAQARASGGFGSAKMGAERLALGLEMWVTPETSGKVGFYIWCPYPLTAGEQHQGNGCNGNSGNSGNSHGAANEEGDHLIKEVRHLIMVHHPRSRVRWVDDPVKKPLVDLMQAPGTAQVDMTWYELGLLANSRYPIGSGASDERLVRGNRSVGRPGSPGAGSDPLAAVIGMLNTDKEVPVMGIQVVIAAQAEGAGQTEQAVNKELARLRELEVQAGRRSLGPQHEAQMLALEEKADRQGFDAIVRLVAVECIEHQGHMTGSSLTTQAETRLGALFRKYRQYDRVIAGVKQGFQVTRRERVPLRIAAVPMPISAPLPPAIMTPLLRRAGAVLGRWPREGICLPQLLPFMKVGKSCILNMAELSAIYHFPHQGLEDVAAVRKGSYRQLLAPSEAHVTVEHLIKGERVMMGMLDADLPPSETPSMAPAGASISMDGRRPTTRAEEIAQGSREAQGAQGERTEGANLFPPGTLGVGTRFEDLRRGGYILGPMGSGKSVLLYNIIVQHIAAGRGVGLLDGKGDSYEEVLRLVPPYLEGEVLTFDPENRSKVSGGGGGGGVGGRSDRNQSTGRSGSGTARR